ncbi:KDR [Bugula neritina]|uniref:Platelet-derived growth factor receptor-like protein n=1 Tax=Bugula neritina TaxID=10212 RepID=A0A7J7JBH1_BUGNE|nr:KDR [Bugula neritina]
MKSISILVFVLVFCEGRYLGLVDDVVPKFMLHTTIHDDIVLEAGESIQLTCSSKMPGSVSWSYPRQKQPNEVEEPTVTILEEVVNENGADQYISKLIVANITTNDTGLYKCSYVISSYDVYVFVSDPTELFQEEHAGIRQPLTGFSRSYVEFPCAVNNPNTTVELLDDSGHGNFIPVPVDGKKCTYDPKTGFTLSKLHIRDSGAYTCKATYGEHEERKEFYLHVLRGN